MGHFALVFVEMSYCDESLFLAFLSVMSPIGNVPLKR
jgi:hypothetical protein|nr:MAG TPA: RBPJ-interacting and tubulin associated protein [Caudoviricetes sp.]